MKNIFCGVFIVLMLFSLSSFVHAQSETKAQYDTKGIYVGLIGGYVMPREMKGDIKPQPQAMPPTSLDYNSDLNNGYLVGAKVGWLTPFSNRALAVEFEYNHIENKTDSWVDNYSTIDFDQDGKIKIDSFMFNLIARYPVGRFHPYIGSGIGCANAKMTDSTVSTALIPGSIAIIGGGSDTVFAYQVMAGLDFDITKNIIAGISYKYLVLDTISFDNNVVELWDGPGAVKLNYKAHNFILSLSYMF